MTTDVTQRRVRHRAAQQQFDELLPPDPGNGPCRYLVAVARRR